MDASPLGEVLTLLALSAVAVALFRRIHLPPIPGYLFLGMIAGHHALGWIPESNALILQGDAEQLQAAEMRLLKGDVTSA